MLQPSQSEDSSFGSEILINNKCKTGVILRTVKDVIDMSRLIAKSRCAPGFHYTNSDHPPWISIFAVLIQGCELGLPVMASVKHIVQIGNATLTLWGDVMLGLVRNHSSCEYIREIYDDETKVATCIGKRVGDPFECIKTFTIEDAEKAGLNKKDNYQKYQKIMFSRRALKQVLNLLWPDVLMGISMTEEFFEADGVVIDPVNQKILLEDKSESDNIINELNNVCDNESIREEETHGN